MSATAYPLQWPDGWPRTPANQRTAGYQFKQGRSGCNWKGEWESAQPMVRADQADYAASTEELARHAREAAEPYPKGWAAVDGCECSRCCAVPGEAAEAIPEPHIATSNGWGFQPENFVRLLPPSNPHQANSPPPNRQMEGE